MYRCPNKGCRQSGAPAAENRFTICLGKIDVEHIVVDGNRGVHDYMEMSSTLEWSTAAEMVCRECGYLGQVKDFKVY